MRIPTLPLDKANHFVWGVLIGLAAFAVAALSGVKFAVVVPVLASFLAGVAKELTDALANKRAEEGGDPPPHSVERKDVLFSTAGGAAVAATALIGAIARLQP